jgi:phosphate starvation-inducible PhoH-like protein
MSAEGFVMLTTSSGGNKSVSKNARRNQRKSKKQQGQDFISEHNAPKKLEIKFLNKTQKRYHSLMNGCDITFAVGSAGTGKTFLAALTAAKALIDEDVKKIVVCRPAVNAGGEELGFLPGGINEKMDPYIRPVLDAFKQAWHPKTLQSYIEMGIIEIVPLAFMRGRTFTNTFIIADEMQNATNEQLLMLITRLGEGSRMVITGDPAQKDIAGKPCFDMARRKLAGVPQIGFIDFSVEDVVRHRTVELVLRLWSAEPVQMANEEPVINGHELGHLPMFQARPGSDLIEHIDEMAE